MCAHVQVNRVSLHLMNYGLQIRLIWMYSSEGSYPDWSGSTWIWSHTQTCLSYSLIPRLIWLYFCVVLYPDRSGYSKMWFYTQAHMCLHLINYGLMSRLIWVHSTVVSYPDQFGCASPPMVIVMLAPGKSQPTVWRMHVYLEWLLPNRYQPQALNQNFEMSLSMVFMTAEVSPS